MMRDVRAKKFIYISRFSLRLQFVVLGISTVSSNNSFINNSCCKSSSQALVVGIYNGSINLSQVYRRYYTTESTDPSYSNSLSCLLSNTEYTPIQDTTCRTTTREFRRA